MTYGDLVRRYIVLNKMERFEKIPQPRCINFVAHSREAEKAATRAEAIAAWRELKETRRPQGLRVLGEGARETHGEEEVTLCAA
jgi:hypothetical protein